ncbi:MAG: aminopeptidase P N-terminal domain-containing protein [Planctomycetes bacterium]|nr:aminopeptidase P N-terminal domain-containing protein [Planctomycetota bacterium]
MVNLNERYAARRAELIKRLGNTAAIFVNPPERLRSGDTHYPYRAESTVLYLSGFDEPEAALLLRPNAEDGKQFVMFVPPKDPSKELWTGVRAGVEGAVSDFGADEAFPLDAFESKLPDLLGGFDGVCYRFGADAHYDRVVLEAYSKFASMSYARAMKSGPAKLVDPSPLVHEMRLYKDAQEVELTRKAVKLTRDGHAVALNFVRPGVREYEVAAELYYAYNKAGGHWSFPAIVAGGNNACTLHYVRNDQTLKDGQLVLIDSGAEYGGYTADVTRTFPVGKDFTKAQRTVYEICLHAQALCCKMGKPGVEFIEMHNTDVRLLVEGLVSEKVLEGPVDKVIEEKTYQKVFPHRTGHWLGLDVHDVGRYAVDGINRKLEPGMMYTVEPGIYIPVGTEGVSEEFWGIGIRIEDDVLVTDTGCEVLTREIPKTAADILKIKS